MTIQEITRKILEFNRERGWDKYHNVRSLLLAIVSEVGELTHIFRWRMRTVRRLSAQDRQKVEEEVADVLIFLLVFCHEMGIDPEKAILEKLQKNAERYKVVKNE